MSASNGAVSRPAEQVCRPGALAAQVDHEIGWAVAGSALDSTLVAFPFGKPVATFPGNALNAPDDPCWLQEAGLKVPGPDHPITISPNPNRVRVTFAGRVVADTTRALTLRE